MSKLWWFERPHYWGKWQLNLYYWYWHDYRCRLEPWTHEWRRYAKKWWWVILIKAAVITGALLWALLFPLSDSPTWVKTVVIATIVVVVTFYGWLLLHLGGYAARIRERFMKVRR